MADRASLTRALILAMQPGGRARDPVVPIGLPLGVGLAPLADALAATAIEHLADQPRVEVGSVLYGYCGGIFGDFYGDKVVEAIGSGSPTSPSGGPSSTPTPDWPTSPTRPPTLTWRGPLWRWRRPSKDGPRGATPPATTSTQAGGPMPDQPTYVDVTIPEAGWDRVHLDPDTQDPLMLDALNGSAPAWLYDLLGCRLTVDPTIPRGILRITTRPTDDLSAFQ